MSYESERYVGRILEKLMMRFSVQEEQQAIFVPPKESFEQKCSSAMEGFLYRRKRMQWKRVWAILTSDKVLNFYKSENYEPVASINLKLGCSAENVVQGVITMSVISK